MSVTAEANGWRVACDWLLGCQRVTVVQSTDMAEVRRRTADRGWTTGKRDTDYCPDHSGPTDA